MNRLQYETSPYLLQHAGNPVDWYAWKPEAFEKAKKEDKPILVSIGYSTCHWCHVMERESFESEEVARYMNEHFVNIKVDREERPDVDQIYMEACQAISGSGGWPLNCFLLPDGRPYFAGTYYPPKQLHNRPSWTQLMQYMSDAYTSRRKEVEEQAEQLMDALKRSERLFLKDDMLEAPAEQLFDEGTGSRIFQALQQQFDHLEGGFGGAPKFPGTMGLRYLMDFYLLEGAPGAKAHLEFSLRKMIWGGIYDQLGGGFARYATDRAWLVPHFEKMLYDNALLVGLLSDAYRAFGDPLYERAIRETLAWVKREMTSPEGAFYAALDADSEGEEGKFYVWSHQEVAEILGDQAPLFCEYYDISPAGNWEGTNILHVTQTVADFAAEKSMSVDEVRAQLADGRMKLFEARDKRVRPGLDDKVLLGWNAMMATAYAKAYAALQDPDFLAAAERSIEFLLSSMKADEAPALLHTYKDGQVQYDAFLDDYALLTEALLELYQQNYDTRLLSRAAEITDFLLEHFLDKEEKLFYFTRAEQQGLPMRRKEIYDSATPSGNSTMVHNLHRLGILLGRQEYSDLSVDMLRNVKSSVEKYPSSFARWARAMLLRSRPFFELAVVGQQAEDKAQNLNRHYFPNTVAMASLTAQDGWPLLEGKSTGGDTNIYVCQEYACKRPVSSVEEAVQLIQKNA